MASKACNESEGSVLQKVQPPKLKKAGAQPGGVKVPVQSAGLPLTKTNLKLMTVLSNSCTVFTGQVIHISCNIWGNVYSWDPVQVDCDNLITPELPVRKISHDLPYQVSPEVLAANLSKILNVMIKVRTKEPKKVQLRDKTQFATKACKCDIAHVLSALSNFKLTFICLTNVR